jgi:hypothetical protein
MPLTPEQAADYHAAREAIPLDRSRREQVSEQVEGDSEARRQWNNTLDHERSRIEAFRTGLVWSEQAQRFGWELGDEWCCPFGHVRHPIEDQEACDRRRREADDRQRRATAPGAVGLRCYFPTSDDVARGVGEH